MKYYLLQVVVGLTVVGLTISCKKKSEVAPLANIMLEEPSHFPAPNYRFESNPLSNEKFQLGRMLFYDPVLSRDSTISCASCHQQFVAFAHSDHPLSHGIDNQFTTRNSPAISNLVWQKEFFADGGVVHIENIAIAPIQNSREMDEKLSHVVYKLNRNNRYKQAFKNAFQKDTIDSQQLLFAMTQFMGTMVSSKSKYDTYATTGQGFSAQEVEGLALFKKNCTPCHQEPLFSDFTYRNNGIDTEFSKDAGRARVTSIAADSGKFKVPSLRNVALTAPYMHDGRMKTLNDVLSHYQSKVKMSSTLDEQFKLANNKVGIVLTNEEKDKIILFLNTLTDNTFITDAKFSNPF
jgi:cytochrome c peroxidase